MIELRKDGVVGKSILVSDVSDGYAEEDLAGRCIKQYQRARQDLIVKRTAKRASLKQQREMFPEFCFPN
jgi:hypothetical protein